MTEINLLPWREQKREQEKKMFTSMLFFGLGMAVITILLIDYFSHGLIKKQISRNQILQNELIALDKQINKIKSLKTMKTSLISRISIIQNLQSTRTLVVHLFDELITILPLGIYVTKLERKNDIVSLWGYSESNANISILMRNIENNGWIQSPVLTEIKKMNGKNQPEDNEFVLNFMLKPKKSGF